jgi:lysophospholipase L1-like esterase
MYPQQGWGGRLPELFKPGVTFSNKAIGSRSTKSFDTEGRMAAIFKVIKKGDYLFIQFGHNDNNPKDSARYTEPFGSYKTYLENYITVARQYGAIPVLVTPMGRRVYNSAGQFQNGFVDRAKAMRELAVEKNVKLIDLNKKSIAFYNGIGPEASADVFMFLEAGKYENYPNGQKDATHFQEYGAHQMAILVAQGIAENKLAIANLIGSITYPAEGAVLGGAVLAKTGAGWRDQGFVSLGNGGSMTLVHVIGGNGGTKTLRIRYANDGKSNQAARVVVNGAETSIALRPTGGSSKWSNQDVQVQLNAGTANTIVLKSAADGSARIDDITVL